MGLCFVGKIRLKDFLEQKVKLVAGPIVDTHGKVLGEHTGLPNYTIGQREGIAVGGGKPLYVVKKDLANNTLVVTDDANDPLLEVTSVEIADVNWITSPLDFKKGLVGRVRHQGELEKLTIEDLGNGHYRATFSKPLKAVASGQSLVMYDGKVCVCGLRLS